MHRFWNVPRGIVPEDVLEVSTSLFFRPANDSNAAAIVPALRPWEVLLAFVIPFVLAPLELDEPRSRDSMRAWAPSPPGCELFRGGIAASRFLTEDVVQYLCHFRRFAILQLERSQRCSCRIGPVEATDPLRGLRKQFWVFCYDHHRVHTRDRLKADDALPQSAIARFKARTEIRFANRLHRIISRGGARHGS